MSRLFLLLFLLKVSKTICDQACDCEDIKLLKDILQQNMLDQKLETSRLFAKIRRLETAQNAKPALVAAKGIENAATFEKMETMYQDMEKMSKDMERMHKDMHSKLNQSLDTEPQWRSSIIKMGLKAEKQKMIELSSKLESQSVNITETFDKHKVETIKMVEQCKSNINSLKDVLEQDVNSTLFKMLKQINVNHESVSSELVKVKHHLDKSDVMISRLNDMTFRSNADSGWAQWGTWSSCSVTCGSGIREKTRTCTNPKPSLFGRHCDGNSRMIQECNNNTCPATLCIDDEAIDCARMDTLFHICQDLDQAMLVCPMFCNLCLLVDGNWAEWTTWSGCDVTCGNGSQTRTRTCTNPAPKFGGLDCVGSSSETKHCSKEACPNHGGWSHWSPWGSCSVTCDIGMQSRDRSCSNPYPSWNGDPCYGDEREDRICMAPACADGAWSTWGSWGSCRESCGGGVKSRLRTCTNPRPSILGKGCEGSSEQVVMCNKNTCSADGTWTQWSAWSNCDVTCANGTQTRLRLCNNPFTSTEQLDCKGNSTDSRQCQKNPCPDYGVAFTVYNPNTTGDSYTVLKFRSSFLNKGDGYNSTTGVFTCRIPGVYHFAVTLTKQYKDISIIGANVQINDSTIMYLYYYPSNEVGSYIMTGAGTYHLNINDTVSVNGIPNYFYSSTYSLFTGFLVSPDG